MSSTGPHSPALPTVVPTAPSALRGRRYGEDRLYLLVRDPRRALAVWELTPATHARARSLAHDRREPLRYEIRLERRAHDRDAGELFVRVDLPDALGGERWYVTLPRAGGWCRAHLGLRLGETFQAVLTSSWVPVPPDGPCAEEGDWDLTPEARAWLDERARAARGLPAAPGSVARFGWPPPPEIPSR